MNLCRKIQILFISSDTEQKDKFTLNRVEKPLNWVIVPDIVSAMCTAGLASFPRNVNLLLGVIPLWLTALKNHLLSKKKWRNKMSAHNAFHIYDT